MGYDLLDWIGLGPTMPFFFLISPFCSGTVYPVPFIPSHFGSRQLVGFLRFACPESFSRLMFPPGQPY